MDRSQIVFGVSFAVLFFFLYFFFNVVWHIFDSLIDNFPVFPFFLLVFFILLPASLVIAQKFTRHFFQDPRT